MSIRGATPATSHLTITAPAATNLFTGGPFTVACLFKRNPNRYALVLNAYRPDNFGAFSIYTDVDLWVDTTQWVIGFDVSTPVWDWFVITKANGTVSPRGHIGTYSSSGSHSWIHHDMGTTKGPQPAINRFCLGDEFGQGPDGEFAVLTSYASDFSDSGVEALFVRSSSQLMNAGPNFFSHFPAAQGLGSLFVDLAGGGVETIRTSDWSVSADPDGFDFSLGRSGKPKVWDGSNWNQHQAKVWDGSAWQPHAMTGYDGTDFVVSK